MTLTIDCPGLFIAAWTSHDRVVQIASGFLPAGPLLLLILFLVTVRDFDDTADFEGAQTS